MSEQTLELSDWVTIGQSAARSNYSERHIRLLATRGEIKAMKLGGRWLVFWPSLQYYEPKAKGWPAGKKRG